MDEEEKKKKEEDEKINKDTEPDEMMSGWLLKNKVNLKKNEEGGNIMSNVVDGIGGGIGFGLSLLKNTVGKAIPIENLEK
jgi:hypothetical protein